MSMDLGRQSGLAKEAVSYARPERRTAPPFRAGGTRHGAEGIFWEIGVKEHVLRDIFPPRQRRRIHQLDPAASWRDKPFWRFGAREVSSSVPFGASCCSSASLPCSSIHQGHRWPLARDRRSLGRRCHDGRDSRRPENVSEAASSCDRWGHSRLRVDSNAKFRNRTLANALESDSRLTCSLQKAGRSGRAESRIYRICWLSLGPPAGSDSGLAHLRLSFPTSSGSTEAQLNGILRYAHQDYLQTALEWGGLGFLLWASIDWRRDRSRNSLPWRDPRAVTRRARNVDCPLRAVPLGVLIHSLVDFPLQIASLQLISAVLLVSSGQGSHDKGDITKV